MWKPRPAPQHPWRSRHRDWKTVSVEGEFSSLRGSIQEASRTVRSFRLFSSGQSQSGLGYDFCGCLTSRSEVWVADGLMGVLPAVFCKLYSILEWSHSGSNPHENAALREGFWALTQARQFLKSLLHSVFPPGEACAKRPVWGAAALLSVSWPRKTPGLGIFLVHSPYIWFESSESRVSLSRTDFSSTSFQLGSGHRPSAWPFAVAIRFPMGWPRVKVFRYRFHLSI